MISAESDTRVVEHAYDLGATDYISRPFDMAVVRRRVINTLLLYAKQKRLMHLVAEQVYERDKANDLIATSLSSETARAACTCCTSVPRPSFCSAPSSSGPTAIL